MLIDARFTVLTACLALSLAACDQKKEVASDGNAEDTAADSESDPGEPTTGDSEGEESSTEAGEETTQGETTEGETTQGEEPYDPHMEDWPEPAEPCAELSWEEQQRDCTDAMGEPGQETCVLVDGKQVWTPCTGEYTCMPGESEDYGCLGYYCAWDGEQLIYFDWQTDPNCDTPLVLRFDAAPLSFSASPAGASFDFRGEPAAATCATDWPSAPWLALDRDRNGSIDSGRELFGSGTRLAAGGRATHGFEALAELDSDGDGAITATDALFSSLVLWSDDNADRVGALSELRPIGDVGLVAIHLAYARGADCDARGNCGGERASFEFRAADGALRVGEVVDVYLACQ